MNVIAWLVVGLALLGFAFLGGVIYQDYRDKKGLIEQIRARKREIYIDNLREEMGIPEGGDIGDHGKRLADVVNEEIRAKREAYKVGKIETTNLVEGNRILIPENLTEEEKQIVRDFYNL